MMAVLGKILLADDEAAFLLATGDLLRQEGYTCDCVPNAAAVLAQLREQRYDVLIADINMPGNTDLEWMQALPSVAAGMPVILVTGCPSQRSAIQAIHLPVVGYLLKPITFKELQTHVATAVQRSRLSQAAAAVKGRMQACQEQLGPLEQVLTAANDTTSGSLRGFLDLTFAHINGALSDVKSLTASLAGEQTEREVCHMLDCPRLEELKAVLEETATVLQKTKRSFKSKDLGAMRAKLEKIIQTPRGGAVERESAQQQKEKNTDGVRQSDPNFARRTNRVSNGYDG